MITPEQAPVWMEYLEMDENLNQYLREDTPDDIREAYEEHQREMQNATEPVER